MSVNGQTAVGVAVPGTRRVWTAIALHPRPDFKRRIQRGPSSRFSRPAR